MVKLRQSGEAQISTILVSDRWIMAQPAFRLGVNDVRAGRPIHPDYDLWDTNGQWNYERGRCFAKLAPRHLPPSPGMVAVLLNAANPDVDPQRQDINAAAIAVGQELRFFYASNESDLEAAFEALVRQRADALLVGNDVFFTNQRQQIVALAAHHAVPTIYAFRQFAESGGLMSYSTNLVEVYRQLGVYIGRVLKGENPANLPVVQPTKFELVINLITAKALPSKSPPALLARADEVIE